MARRNAYQRGYDHRWRKERAAFLAVNPWCALQGDGCTKLAEVVDHIIPHKGDVRLFNDKNNLQPLCAHCHNVHKAMEEAVGPERDHRGRLILAR